jgi:hypothetical protein
LVLLCARDQKYATLREGLRVVLRQDAALELTEVVPEPGQPLVEVLAERVRLSCGDDLPDEAAVADALCGDVRIQHSVIWVEPPDASWLGANLAALDRLAGALNVREGTSPALIVPHVGTREDVSEYRVGAHTVRKLRWGPHLDSFAWQGWCAPLDARMALEEHPELEPGLHRPIVRRLLHSVALEVGLWDADLRDALLRAGEPAAVDPTDVVRAYQESRWGDELPGLSFDQRTWLEGGWERWDGVPRSHSCALLAGDGSGLRTRIWRAHMLCLFPLLEELRPLLIDEVRSHFHKPLTVTRDNEKVDLADPCELELGELAFHCYKQAPGHPKRKLLNQLRLVRNHLAHQTPVGPKLLQTDAVLRELERVLRAPQRDRPVT